jgi:Fur family ferric uptake transcriptional regulator
MEKTQIPRLPRQHDFVEKLLPKRESFSTDDLKGLLRQLNLKVTEQRLLILQILNSGQRKHVTAQELYEKVSEKDSSVGFATVYRMLRKLAEAGFVTEVRVGSAPARYELNPKNHHDHITCIRCGKICEFHNAELEGLQAQIAKSLGFTLTSHVMELYGICKTCLQLEGQVRRTSR